VAESWFSAIAAMLVTVAGGWQQVDEVFVVAEKMISGVLRL